MNRRTQLLLFFALVVALGCAWVVWRVMGNATAQASKVAPKHVVAVAQNIKVGTVLAATDLTTIDISGTVPQGMFVDVKNVIGRGVISELYLGEPIIENRLAAVGSGGGLAAIIPPGMRACAIKVDDVVGVSGFATPGMYVDVLVSGTPPANVGSNPADGTLVRTLLQNLKVLSAGTDIQKDTEGKAHTVQVVNLLVTPEQAETLSLASNQEHIQLVLRNPLDTQVAEVPGNAQGNLFTGGKPKDKPVVAVAHKAVKKVTPEDQVIVFNGTKGTVTKFAAPEGKQ
jgi:pilus assembly protein CpaB